MVMNRSLRVVVIMLMLMVVMVMMAFIARQKICPHRWQEELKEHEFN